MSRIRAWLRREEGVSEAATAIFILPLIAALIFLIVDTGFDIRTRTVIDGIVQDTTRSVALDGGYKNARSTSLDPSYSQGWQTIGTNRLIQACQSGSIQTAQNCLSLSVVCTPQIAANVGDNVSCSLGTPITYKTLSPMSTNPLFSFGMSGLFTTPINSTSTSVAAVGSNG
jgi:Flp pilus assembly protein TadG